MSSRIPCTPFTKTALVALTGLLVASIAVSGCKPKKKAGGACAGDEASCLDKSNILECHGGKYEVMACSGPKGCAEKLKGATRSGRTVTNNYLVECDFTANAAGSPCLDDGSVCAGDKKAMVTCKNKKIEITKCLGAKACSEGATTIDCDTTIQTLGETCEGDEVACSVDKKEILRCANAKFVLGQKCRGAKGCSVNGQKISCDEGEQVEAEPCSPDGNYACTADKKALLKCAAFKWTIDEKCKGKKTCQTRGDEVGCQ